MIKQKRGGVNIWRVAIFTATDVQEEIRQKVVAADDRNRNRHLVSSMGDIYITCRSGRNGRQKDRGDNGTVKGIGAAK